MKVNEIFTSISGEVGRIPQGTLSTFIRFQGCNLRCRWCDTPYAQDYNGPCAEYSVSQILEHVDKIGCRNVILTGGEPMFQDHAILLDLVASLHDRKYIVQIESNGSFRPLKGAAPYASYVMDYKLKGSFMSNHMAGVDMFAQLRPNFDWIKFVISDAEDYKQAMSIVDQIVAYRHYNKYAIAGIAFAPVAGVLDVKTLQEWMIEDQAYYTINVQLHKLAHVK